uniref:Uncharacterized protein n=1 Tax=Siphoviridae sp. ct7GD8 TaxID=2827785 RepID=A0A8S5T5B1_9CAUD|nr:MAG TPA: hypothetical protein [Siphoviridae sp. ct7GD8]
MQSGTGKGNESQTVRRFCVLFGSFLFGKTCEFSADFIKIWLSASLKVQTGGSWRRPKKPIP